MFSHQGKQTPRHLQYFLNWDTKSHVNVNTDAIERQANEHNISKFLQEALVPKAPVPTQFSACVLCSRGRRPSCPLIALEMRMHHRAAQHKRMHHPVTCLSLAKSQEIPAPDSEP